MASERPPRLAGLFARNGYCPSCGAWQMSRTAAHLVDHVVPQVPVRWQVLSLPIPRRMLPAAQPGRVTLTLQVVQRVITRQLWGRARLEADKATAVLSR